MRFYWSYTLLLQPLVLMRSCSQVWHIPQSIIRWGKKVYHHSAMLGSFTCTNQHDLIEASLSKPHTSGTALRKCVCMLVCLLACVVQSDWCDIYFSAHSWMGKEGLSSFCNTIGQIAITSVLWTQGQYYLVIYPNISMGDMAMGNQHLRH